MKLIKIIGHPYTVIISFLLLMISGEHLGGPYILYIMLALPYLAIHALLAIAGIILLLIVYKLVRSKVISIFLNIAAYASMLLSLYFFFSNDSAGYNDDTFYQPVPLFTFGLFAIILLASLIRSLYHSKVKVKTTTMT
ncbi:MAG: hypothetical protein QM764_18155 [Chitinophagaceae bacterium]